MAGLPLGGSGTMPAMLRSWEEKGNSVQADNRQAQDFASGFMRYRRTPGNIVNFTLHPIHSDMIYMNNNFPSQVQ
jgi:hypothetical protein